ncbi:MAG TPA: DUF5985 family protein [Rhizomicrobium sp.]|jgi:FtsH-binding integral membrane protein|nr:DUF5985 family protein [Rhizomicrobium sp.]
MTQLWPALVYLLCLTTSALCAALLLRSWWLSRSRLLWWTAISFIFFALNNLALVADTLVFTQISLWAYRFIPNLIGLCLLLYGFVWEVDR